MDVNIAQRLATDARSGEILITQAVRRDLGSQYSVKEESSRLLKGLKVPIPVFSIAAE
jgi:class 3 adenylate cyclase